MKTYLPMATFVASVLLLNISTGLAQGTARPTAPPRNSAGTTVAVIDVNYIFKNHARFKSSMDDIKRDIETFEAHLRDERNKITAKTEDLKRLPAGSAQYTQLEEQIAKLHTDLNLEMSRKRKEILEREAKIYYNFYKEIEQTVSLFADRFGIGLVLRFSSEDMDSTKRDSVLQGINRAVVFQRNLNITTMILKDLNRGTPGPEARGRGPQVPGGSSFQR